EGHSTKVDIGKMNNLYFINLAAGGQLTQESYETPSKLKSIVGPFAYYIKGFEMLPQKKAVDLRIEYDVNVFQGEAVLIFL
ncbi:diacylglycerol kinase, partial [Staphylococcus aureus]|nr:diacylglycerol kinase [Staphylococcus aureus]